MCTSTVQDGVDADIPGFESIRTKLKCSPVLLKIIINEQNPNEFASDTVA